MTFSQVMSQCIQTLTVSPKGVHSVIQLKNGDLVVASADCILSLYVLEKTQFTLKDKLTIPKIPHTMGYDYTRGQIYVGCAGGSVEVVQVDGQKMLLISSLKWSKREISHITYRMDADVVMSAGFDGTLTVYSPRHQKKLTQTQISKDPVRYLCYDDVGGKLYVGTHAGGIPVYRLEEPERSEAPTYCYTLATETKEYSHRDPVRCIILDMKTRYMFSCDHSGKILVWHTGAAGQETEREALGQLDGHIGHKLRALCWLHEERALLSAGENGRIVVHNVGLQRAAGNFQAHQDELMGVAAASLRAPGSFVVSWAKDGRVCVWRLAFKME